MESIKSATASRHFSCGRSPPTSEEGYLTEVLETRIHRRHHVAADVDRVEAIEFGQAWP